MTALLCVSCISHSYTLLVFVVFYGAPFVEHYTALSPVCVSAHVFRDIKSILCSLTFTVFSMLITHNTGSKIFMFPYSIAVLMITWFIDWLTFAQGRLCSPLINFGQQITMVHLRKQFGYRIMRKSYNKKIRAHYLVGKNGADHMVYKAIRSSPSTKQIVLRCLS